MPRGEYGDPAKKALAAWERAHAGPSPLAKIGSEWFHSVDDRQRAIEQISAGFNALVTEIMRWHDERPDRHTEAFIQWVQVDAMPMISQWNQFAAKEKASWWVRAATRWETFVGWRERLKHLRQLARAHGILLESPEPEPLPMTIWEKSDDGTGNELAPWFGIAKIVIGAAVAFTGAVTVYSVANDFRKLRASSASKRHHEDTPDE